MLQKKVLIILLGTVALAGCHRGEGERLIVVDERYVHQYGVEIGADEWQTRGQNGQVIATLDNGVAVSKQYIHGTLNGETTYTFPHSSVVEHVDTYDGGVLLKTVYNDQTGHPKEEVRFQGNNFKTVTAFYDTLAPRCREIYRDDYLTQGEYYTQDSKTESRIANGHGIKILRNESGELLGEATYDAGKLVQETYFYPNGNPLEIIPYKNGLIEGTKRTFLINGEPNTIEEWSQSKPNGITTVFKNGDKFSEIPYVKGRKEGVEVRYRDGKTKAEEITWEKDKMHGPYHSYFGSSIKTEWYISGNRVTKASFEQQ